MHICYYVTHIHTCGEQSNIDTARVQGSGKFLRGQPEWMTGQSRLSLSSLSSSIHSSLFRPFSPSPRPRIYMSRHGAVEKERGEEGRRVDRRRIKPMRSLQLCSLSLSFSLSVWLRTIRCIRRRAHYKTGEYKRQRWVETDPPTSSSTEQASSHPAGNLLSSYFNISRNSANTAVFPILLFPPLFFFWFVSFRFHSLSSFLFFFLLFPPFSSLSSSFFLATVRPGTRRRDTQLSDTYLECPLPRRCLAPLLKIF